jgi:signal transduction histidine kinase
VDGFSKRSGIDVSFITEGAIAQFPGELNNDLFRVVQEGLTNVVRHSGSESATVRMQHQNGEFILQIHDNGCRVADSQSRTWLGVGIASMRERLRRFGGALEIRSEATGATLIARVPITTPAEDRVSLQENGHETSLSSDITGGRS